MPLRKANYLINFTLIFTLLLGLLISCSNKKDQSATAFNPVFQEYLSAYTAGEISRTSPIEVRFAKEMVALEQVGETLKSSPFEFNPPISGTASWANTRTIHFQPEKNLPSGTPFEATLNLKGIKDSLPEMPNQFLFQFATMPQDVMVELSGVKTIDLKKFKWQKIEGVLRTTDFEAAEVIEKIFSARINNKNLNISWDHNEEDFTHTFVVDSVPRTSDKGEVLLAWNGKAQNLQMDGQEKVSITPLGSFQLSQARTFNNPEQYILLEFSDPIDKQQNLNGLIRMGNNRLRYVVNNNQVKVFPQSQMEGVKNLIVERGIKNLAGEKLTKRFSKEISFESPLPQLRLIGDGVILPRSNALPFIFESIGLKAVDIRIIKIHEKNVHQFLQVNQLDGKNQLKRVGEVLVHKKIDLDERKFNLNSWTQHAVDLGPLISPEAGAIYEVALGFHPDYSLYGCEEIEGGTENIDMLRVSESWDEPGYGEYDYYYYDWSERNNPCHRAYYNNNKIVKRNILSSDLGIIAKKGPDGTQITITDLGSTAPVNGVTVEIYDYQQKLLTTATTDNAGQAYPQIEEKPFLLVAKSGSQRGYLRMDDGSSLSLSRFDVGGTAYNDGLKGYLYGERGVWRPGDEMYLTFILQDQLQKLPANHPVTFNLTNPRGQKVSTITKTEGNNGFYTFPVKTAADAPTGNYEAEVSVGGAKFYKTIKVETIVPNRLAIDLDFGAAYLSASASAPNTKLGVKWLHGAIGKNLDAEVNVSLYPQKTSFNNFNDFNFDDPVRLFDTEEITLFEGKLDEKGQAVIPAKISTDYQAPGKLRANFITRAFEPGGGFSIDQFNVDYHPYNTYVGIKTPQAEGWRKVIETGKNHTIEIATVNPEGKGVSRAKLKVSMYKLDWKWWWDRSRDDVSNYQGKVYADVVKTATISTQNGKGSWSFKVDNEDWGRYLIRIEDPNGHATAGFVYLDWPGYAGRTRSMKNDGAKMLSFTADKEAYTVGEKVSLNIPTGFSGRALVSIEKGTKVIESHWVEANAGVTQFSFKTTEAMAPNVYAHVSLMQPHAQTQNDLPIRMYGVLPIKVDNPKTHLKPSIAMQDVLAPNEEFSVKVSESDGKAMTYTLAVVDEGLLNLTRFKTPSPHNSFYAKEALNVKTWDMFDHVIGAYGGEIKSLLSIGGGMENEGVDGGKQNRFKPVVKFLGPFTLKKGERKEHELVMPNYVGSVRVMVVAGKEGAYGATEKQVAVKKPLMVLGSLPRVLGPGEELEIPATIFAMEDNIRQVEVRVETNEMLEISGTKRHQLAFNGSGDQMVGFPMKVKPTAGTGSVRIIASSGSETAIYETDIDIRLPNPPVTEVQAARIGPGKSLSQNYQPLGIPGTNALTLEVSSVPPMNLGRRLKYLLRYPYGCIEQTTSSVFPQLFVSNLMELKNDQKEKIKKNVTAGIKRLGRFQLGNGGFGYWMGAREATEWGTNYAGHFLLEAKNTGYQVPQAMLNSWQSFQRQKANSWTPSRQQSWAYRSGSLTQAYRLFLLASSGKPEMGAMNRLRQEKDLYGPAKWYLAAAYYQAGQRKVAQRMIKGLSTEVPEYKELSYTYGSTLRDKAVILQCLSLMDQQNEADKLVNYISGRLSDDSWISTQSTAYSLIAMSDYVGRNRSQEGFSFAYKSGKEDWNNISSSTPIWQFEGGEMNASKIEFKNNSSGQLFVRLISEGTPLQGDNRTIEKNLKLSVSYWDLNNKPIDPARIEQGTEFIAQVSVTNTGNRNYREMAINQIFPSGWEIFNTRLYDSEFGGTQPTYQDIRDDRVYTFFDLNRGKSKTFKVRLSASYPGKYYLPTVAAEAMYDNDIYARTGGQWVEVVRGIVGG